MSNTNQLEVWMRGPVEGLIPMLQPVAHALLQASEEVAVIMQKFDDSKLWLKPAGLASAGFHLLHMKGVLERLFSYAKPESLTAQQLSYLQNESVENPLTTSTELVLAFQDQVKVSIEYLKALREDQLIQGRGIGRKQIPTNVIGLLFHAAEHTQRHLGQLLVTTKVVSV